MPLVLGEMAFIWVVPAAGAPAFLPLPGLRAFTASDDAEQFVEVMWQVEAAALALSLAIVIFAFEAIYATRMRGSLRQFAEQTGLFPIFYIGAASLAVDAMVLLGAGHDAPGGWAATWAVIWGAANLILLALLFVLTLRAIEPAALREGRMSRARRDSREAAEEIILERLAGRILEQECGRVGLQYDPFFGSRPSTTATAVSALEVGRVVDIRLRRLRKLGALAREVQVHEPVLTTAIGKAVGAGSVLMWLEPGLLRLMPGLRRSFRTGTVIRGGLREGIEQLHEEGIEAIRAGATSRYRDVARVYREMLLGAEEAWAPFRSPP